MKDTVTLKELTILVIRRIKVCLCVAIIFALLFGSLKMTAQISAMKSPDNTAEKVEALYAAELEEYQESLFILKSEYEHKKNQLEAATDYQNKSLLYKIDPSNQVVSQSILSAANLEREGSILKDELGNYVSSSPEMIVLSHYYNIWESANLKEALGMDIEDIYLREVVSVQIVDGVLLNISAIGATADDAKALTDAAVKFLQSHTKAINASYGSHDLILLSSSVKVSSEYTEDPSTKQDIQKTINTLKSEVLSAEQALERLNEPEKQSPIDIWDVITDTVIQIIIGAVIGGVFGAVLIIIGYLFSNRLTHIICAERQFPDCFTVSLALPKTKSERLSDKLLGERVWESKEQALSYLEKFLESADLKNKTLALVTTLKNIAERSEISQIKDILEKLGATVVIADNAYYNPEAVKAISNADMVVILEEYNKSKLNEISAIFSIINEQEKELKSVVII